MSILNSKICLDWLSRKDFMKKGNMTWIWMKSLFSNSRKFPGIGNAHPWEWDLLWSVASLLKIALRQKSQIYHSLLTTGLRPPRRPLTFYIFFFNTHAVGEPFWRRVFSLQHKSKKLKNPHHRKVIFLFCGGGKKPRLQIFKSNLIRILI